jgi:hypothetical protein
VLDGLLVFSSEANFWILALPEIDDGTPVEVIIEVGEVV